MMKLTLVKSAVLPFLLLFWHCLAWQRPIPSLLRSRLPPPRFRPTRRGYLDLEFNALPGVTDPASAAFTGFTTDGTLGSALPDIGDVAGSLPGTVAIDNTGGFNDYTIGFTPNTWIFLFPPTSRPFRGTQPRVTH
jgi:hypothetical protein